VATPEALSTPVPNTVDPSWNVTVPVALLSADVTAAVNVTELPGADGLLEEVTTVEVAKVDA
jgi:hypothetical protein